MLLEMATEFWYGLTNAVWFAASGLKWIGTVSSRFARDTFRAHYNLLGQFTAPLEQERLSTEPPPPSSLNILGQLVLFPVVILAWVFSVTVAPLLYNSFLLSIPGFLKTANFALLDLPEEEQIRQPRGSMPWYRLIYGIIPGYLLGAIVGLVAAGGIGLVRMIANSFVTAIHSFASVTNLALHKDDEIKQFGLRKNEPFPIKAYGFGFPGLILGGLLGTVGFTLAGLGRVIVNSVKTAVSLTISAVNLARHDNDDEQFDGGIEEDDGRNDFLKFGLGFPGLLIGFVTGAIGLSLSGFLRFVAESGVSAELVWITMVNKAYSLGKEEAEVEADHAQPVVEQVEVEQRHWADRYVFGVPGYLLGALFGSLGFTGVIVGRVVYNSVKTSLHTFATVTNLALDEEYEIKQYGLKRNERYPIRRFGFGFPGLVLGGLAGIVGFTGVGLGRILINSYATTKGITMAAMNLVRHDNEQLDQSILTDGRDPILKYGLGFPGFIIGSVTGLIGFSWASLQRSAAESWITTKELSLKMTKQAWPVVLSRLDFDRDEEVLVPERLGIDYYLFGAPGLLLGSIAGGIGFTAVAAIRMIVNSAISSVHGFSSVINLALHPDDRIQRFGFDHEERESESDKSFGLPGAFLGVLFAGTFGYLAVAIGRIATNSYKTAKELTISGINIARFEDEPEIEGGIEHENGRSGILKFGLGFPGLLIGSLGASLAIVITSSRRVRKESVKTWNEVFNAFIKKAMPALPREEGEAGPAVDNEEIRTIANRYIFGLPGLIFGALAGSIVFAAIIARRSYGHSVQSAKISFDMVTNLARDPNDEIQGLSFDDGRNPSEKYGFGFPGVVLGGLAGSIGFTFIGLGRIISDSFKTAKGLTVSAVNLARHTNEQLNGGIEQDDGRGKFRRYVLGFPGLIIGSATGTIGLGLSTLRRFVIESWVSTVRVTTAMTKRAYFLGDEDRDMVEPDLAPESEAMPERPGDWADRYVFGVPGYLLGALFGSLGFTGVIVGRVVYNSVKTSLHTFATVTNLALDEEYEIKQYGLKRNERHPIRRFGFGFPGLVLGGLAGVVGFTGVGLGRILTNSYTTAKGMTIAAMNLVRHDNEQLDESILTDGRDPIIKYGLGFPGFLIGSVTSLIGIGWASMRRALIESRKTSNEIYTKIVREGAALDGVEGVAEQRSFVDRYIFGFPGLVIGGLSGGAVVVGRGLHRGFRHSFDTGTRIFASIANLGLEGDERFPYQELGQDDDRSWQQKYLLGLPGVIIGGLFGIVTLAGIGSVKLATQSFHSWRSLSGSFLNGSLEYAHFGGLAADKRSDNAKLSGILGYALAMVTTFPLGILILSFRKIIPVSLGLLVAFISSPFVALGKGIKQAVTPSRFAEREEVEDAVEQRFKNIYSSLNGWGQLAANEAIREGQNGRKGPYAFTRKALTFNLSTKTEYILDQVLAGYRASQDKANFFDNGEFAAILAAVKDYYGVMGCQYEEDIVRRNREIDEIGRFVKDYVVNQGADSKVPENLYAHTKRSWTATFWGAEPAAVSRLDDDAVNANRM